MCGGDGGIELTGAVVGKGEFVPEAGGPIVEEQRGLVGIRGKRVALHLIPDVSEALEWARGSGIERGRRPKVVGRGVEIAPALIRLATPEVGEHGVGTQRDRAAIRLDGTKRLVLGECGVPPRKQPLVFAVPGDGLVRDGRGEDGDGQDDQDREEAVKKTAHLCLEGSLHGTGTSRSPWCLNCCSLGTIGHR